MKQTIKIICLIVVSLVFCIGLYWVIDKRGSIKVAHLFLYAIQNQDWKTVTELLHPHEKERLGLNIEKIKIIGEKSIIPIWNILGIASDLQQIDNPFIPTTEEEKIFFKNFYFFQILRGNKKGAIILVTKTKEGWRVNFSLFVYTLLTEAAEYGKLNRNQIRPILWQSGIFQIFVGQESLPLPP